MISGPRSRAPNCPEPGPAWRPLADFTVPGAPGDTRQAVDQIAEAVRVLRLPPACLAGLMTAVADAVLKAIERGQAPLRIRVSASGGPAAVPRPLAPGQPRSRRGEPSPRGWTFFQIERIMDDPLVVDGGARCLIDLFIYREGEQSQAARQ